jgi:hypothetical protein
MADAPHTESEPDADAPAGPAGPEQAVGDTTPFETTADDTTADDTTAGAPEDLKSSFRDALARKAGRNSHVENHLDGRHLGSGNNDTRKRQFRRKSG